MMQRDIKLVAGFLMASGLAACSGGNGSLPTTNTSIPVAGAISSSAALRTSAVAQTNGQNSYTYTAPWGGFGASPTIYLLPKAPCSFISATQAVGFSWPSFLNKLAQGTTITLSGTPSYKDGWSVYNKCPTGGIVVTAIAIGTSASPAPVASPTPSTAPGIKIITRTSASGDWLADRDYSGGQLAATSAAINMSHVANPAPQAVYQSQRYGSTISYVIPKLTPNAPYAVRLHFAETYWTSANERVFNATINGSQVLSNFDIFASAGGANIAIAKEFNSNADRAGNLSIGFAATRDFALISGIEVTPGAASPTPAPPSSPTPVPSTTYPVYSTLFTGANNPFHMTVASLVSRGARLQSQTLMNNLWNQGYYSEDALNYPIYHGVSGETTRPVECTFWGNCNPNGYSVHGPAGATQEAKGDHHITFVDTAEGLEFDGWGGASGYGGGPCSVGSAVNCSWGGFYPLSGKGLTNSGMEGNHAGFAFGLFAITAQEILQGHIDHALGMNSQCLDNPSVYPADTRNGSDWSCSGGGGASPAPAYGMMVHLTSSYNVSASPYSPACKTILTALQAYGAYLYDTGNQGLYVAVEDPETYSGTNPWYSQIYPQMASYGDAGGSGSSWSYSSCLNHLNANNFEVYTVPNLGY